MHVKRVSHIIVKWSLAHKWKFGMIFMFSYDGEGHSTIKLEEDIKGEV